MRTPFTCVPFVEPRSCTHTPSRRASMRDVARGGELVTLDRDVVLSAAADRERRGFELVTLALLEHPAVHDDEAACAERRLPRAPPTIAGWRTKLSCGSRMSVAAVRTMRQTKR